MTQRKSLQEQALEVLVYVPVGAALTARDEVPKLAAKGRAYVTTQITMARTVGNFAVTFGGREAEKQVLRAVRKLGSFWGERPVGRIAEEAPKPVSPSEAQTAPGAPAGVRTNGNSSHLAIVGYDSLSASQVVQRLAGLERDELEAVRDYEAKTRSRATILNRASQLLADGLS